MYLFNRHILLRNWNNERLRSDENRWILFNKISNNDKNITTHIRTHSTWIAVEKHSCVWHHVRRMALFFFPRFSIYCLIFNKYVLSFHTISISFSLTLSAIWTFGFFFFFSFSVNLTVCATFARFASLSSHSNGLEWIKIDSNRM